MDKKRLLKLGQSTAEFATLFSIIVGAIILMQLYVKRALQARQKDAMVHYMRDVLGMPQDEKYQYVAYYSTSNITQEETRQEDVTMKEKLGTERTVAGTVSYAAGSQEKQEGNDILQVVKDNI